MLTSPSKEKGNIRWSLLVYITEAQADPSFAETTLRPKGLTLGARLFISRPTLIQSCCRVICTHPLFVAKNGEINNHQHSTFQSFPFSKVTVEDRRWLASCLCRRFEGGKVQLETGIDFDLRSLSPSQVLTEYVKIIQNLCTSTFTAAQITAFLLQMVRVPGANAVKVKKSTAPIED